MPVTTASPIKYDAFGADRFFAELLDSVESLGSIADEYGVRTLVDLMYLQNAILNGTYVDHYPGESNVRDLALALPSGNRWGHYIKVVPENNTRVSK